ncbi:hypothetical protein L538_0428 [Bordetella hinzii 4161]|nr:hypothetical protein L538_0428 [Bordetella hinzii 4161]
MEHRWRRPAGPPRHGDSPGRFQESSLPPPVPRAAPGARAR